MDIKILNASTEAKWDQFITEQPDTSLFQLTGWKKTVEKTYGHESYYLFAEENSRVVGILPLFLVNSLVFGKRLVSVPYGPYAGCSCLGSCSNPTISSALIARAAEIAGRHNVKYLELRNTDNVLELPSNNLHVTLLLDLTQGEDKVWYNIRKGMKACVKKAAKESFNINLDSGNIKGFYSIYCRRMHELGTPVPPLSFFTNILDNFPGSTVATIDYKGEVLAAQVLLYFKKTVIYGWGASINHYSESHPVHALLWKVIQNCILDGYSVFDFGRSAIDSGTYDFKKWWGAEPKQLYYQYMMYKGQEVPHIHPSNPKYGLLIKVWQKIPLPLANWLGPYASKELI